MKCFVINQKALPVTHATTIVNGLQSPGDTRHSIEVLAGGYYMVLLHDERGKELAQSLLDANIDVTVLHGGTTEEGLKALVGKALAVNSDLVKARLMTELVKDTPRSPFDLSGFGSRR